MRSLSQQRDGSEPKSWDVIVVGAGAAGMLCAARAAERGRRVLLLEKNTKAGVKILMSGGTRCNLTHDASPGEIADAFSQLGGKEKGRFLRPALSNLTPDALIALFAAEGLETKIEPTGKVFPKSDRALDVQRALLRMLDRTGAVLSLAEPVHEIEPVGDGYSVVTAQRTLACQKVVIAVGGQSYPGCGTTGDGYAWAKRLGHRVLPPRAALAPLTSQASWARELQGITLPDVRVRVGERGAKPLIERRGSFLFTHFGLSGPAVMDASRFVTERPDAGNWVASCDFLPSVNEEALRAQLQEETVRNGKRSLGGLVAEWAPKRVAESLLLEAGAPGERRLAELSRGERNAVLASLKRMEIPLSGSLGFKKAEVTAGGVDLAEVDPRTLQSKLAPGAYFIGEVLDLDGPIGGYNFQAAFSTGALAADNL